MEEVAYPRNFKAMKLTIPSLTAPYVEYLSTCLLRHPLNTCKITMDEVDFQDWIDEIGMEAAVRLGKSFNKLNHLQFTVGLTRNDRDGGENSEPASLEVKANTFYRLLNAIVKGRNFENCTSVFPEELSGRGETVVTLERNNCLFFHYPIDRYGVDNFDLPIINKDITITGAKIINNFRLFIQRHTQTVPSQILQYAFKNCPYLEDFETGCHSSHLRPEGTSVYYIHQPTPTKDNIIKIQLDGTPLTQDIVDILSTYLLNIETLICSACYIDENTDLETRHDDAVLDLTKLKELENVTFSIENVIVDEYDHLFVRFIYNQSEESYYDIRPLGARSHQFTCSSVTPSFVRRCRDDPLVVVKSITFKCNKIAEFVLCSGPPVKVIAEFQYGELQSNPSPLRYNPVKPVYN